LFGFGGEVDGLDVGGRDGFGRSCSIFSVHDEKKF
jgi:hypothetical protein